MLIMQKANIKLFWKKRKRHYLDNSESLIKMVKTGILPPFPKYTQQQMLWLDDLKECCRQYITTQSVLVIHIISIYFNYLRGLKQIFY